MENNLKTLLDKIYELEGLVHLAIERPDRRKDFMHLINAKGKDVGLICQNFPLTSSYEKGNDPGSGSVLEEYAIDENTESPDYIESDNSGVVQSNDKEKRNRRGKLVFTINERYRYKRELFENSDADFNNTLAVLASMEDYDEAEEYFISEEGFNMGNPVVREFMEVIKKYFK